MSASPRTARSIGWLYLSMVLPAPFNLVYIPSRFIVSGDAAATAANINASELTFRFGILSGLITNALFIALAVALYGWLKDVDRVQARLLLMFAAVGAILGLGNLLNEIAPLILLSGANYLAPFSRTQLESLAYGILRLRSQGMSVEMAFWGLWLFPFGVLVIKSRFIPKWIGIALIVGCFAWLAESFTGILFPASRGLVDQIMTPLYSVGELSMVGWLLWKGGKIPLPG